MEKIGKYEIREKIGSGGFGIVYRALDPFIQREVAIKACLSSDERARQRFQQEAQIVGNLVHPNITTVYDSGLQDDMLFLVVEYLSGEDLSQKIQRRDPIPLAVKIGYLIQIAQGLEYAHSRGVIHRDIKPGNIRVLEGGQIKIMDFGTAKIAGSATRLTQSGLTLGTLAYLSPEQIQGEELIFNSDIFSLGVVAYELISYRRPFAKKKITELLNQIVREPSQPITDHWPECPRLLRRILIKALKKSPERRYRSCAELILDLRRVLAAIDDRVSASAMKLASRSEVVALLREAQGLLQKQEYERSLRLVRKALEAEPDHPGARELFSGIRTATKVQAGTEEGPQQAVADAVATIQRYVAEARLDDAERALEFALRTWGHFEEAPRLRQTLEIARAEGQSSSQPRTAPLTGHPPGQPTESPASDLPRQGPGIKPDVQSQRARTFSARKLAEEEERAERQKRRRATVDAATSIDAYLARGDLLNAQRALDFAVSLMEDFELVDHLQQRIDEAQAQRSEPGGSASTGPIVGGSGPESDELPRSSTEPAPAGRRRAVAIAEAVESIEALLSRGDPRQAQDALEFAVRMLGDFEEARELRRKISAALS